MKIRIYHVPVDCGDGSYSVKILYDKTDYDDYIKAMEDNGEFVDNNYEYTDIEIEKFNEVV